MVTRRDNPQAWLAAYVETVTAELGSPIRLVWDDKRSGVLSTNGMALAAVSFVDGGTDSTEGPGYPMRLDITVQGLTFAYAVALDDDLAALDWALHDMGGQLSSASVLESLQRGFRKRHDHSRLLRGERMYAMLQSYAEGLVSLPVNKLTLWTDPPDTVKLSYQDNYVELSTGEHDTVIVWYSGLSVSLECPVWVHGLESWVDDFFRRLRTEDLWLVGTKVLGVPVHKDFLFDEDLPAFSLGGMISKSSELFLPAAYGIRSSPQPHYPTPWIIASVPCR